MSTNNEPQLREQHPTDKYGTKLVNEAGKLQEKAEKLTDHGDGDDDKKSPAGGFDDTPLPTAPPGHTIRITFHRAENLPFSDFPTLSTDPYVHATFKTNLQKRHKQDPDLYLRTPTIHRNTKPIWATQWVIAHVPASGFHLKCRLYDEDPADHDDRLGNVHVNVGSISDNWPGIKEQSYDLKKRMGSKRAYTFRGVAALLNRSIKMSAQLIVSVENLGISPGESGGRCYTVGPLTWVRHYSPLIGRIAGVKDYEESKDGKKKTEKYNFQAVQMQLRGPVPEAMYHRYVEFKPFVAGMFTDATLRGRILNRALHHQHARVYNYDSTTNYGIFEKPSIEMTKQFLEFVHYDQGGRLFTYVLSLDGLWRFTETGKEFGIDMLSKHTMHSDVSIYIAFSGEFFVRRLRHPRRTHDHDHDDTENTENLGDIASPATDQENEADPDGPHKHGDIPKDPSNYELIIDNDSGTYRPYNELLPLLKEYMSHNLPGLRVATLDCQKDEEKMKKLKQQQRDRKEESGKQITYMQNSSASSLSASDEEKLEARAKGEKPTHGYKKKMSKLGFFRRKQGDEKVSKDSQSTSRHLASEDEDEDEEDRDSRDFSSSVSSHDDAERHDDIDGGRTQGEGYENHELPTLLKKDPNGQIPRPPQQAEAETEKEKEKAKAKEKEKEKEKETDEVKPAELETGENRPAGGIAYGKIVPNA